MRLPKKITPDRIRESIVQIFITSEIPPAPLVGYVYEVLSEMGFAYSNKPPRQPRDQASTANPNLVDLLITQHLYFNEEIKIQLHENGSLIFNCFNSYIGWEKYQGYIQKIVNNLYSKKIVQGFHRVGIRYISEFPNTDIFENLNFTIALSGLNKPINKGKFRMEWIDAPYRIVLNLVSNQQIQPIIEKGGTKVDFVSLTDIDVIHDLFRTISVSEVFKIIDEVHLKEKEIFFGLLKQEFLETLKPIY
jgi:uncharacterized protein (TIGR04255 family)